MKHGWTDCRSWHPYLVEPQNEDFWSRPTRPISSAMTFSSPPWMRVWEIGGCIRLALAGGRFSASPRSPVRAQPLSSPAWLVSAFVRPGSIIPLLPYIMTRSVPQETRTSGRLRACLESSALFSTRLRTERGPRTIDNQVIRGVGWSEEPDLNATQSGETFAKL